MFLPGRIGKTDEQKKKVLSTVFVFGLLTVITASLATFFGIRTPRDRSCKSIQGEAIQTLIDGKTGDDYFISGKTELERRDASSDRIIQDVPFLEQITALTTNETLLDGSLTDFNFNYLSDPDGSDYLFAFDTVGNIFKFRDDGENLVLSDDCYIATEHFNYRLSCSRGSNAYIISSNENNRLNIREFDMDSLSQREIRSKNVYTLSKSDSEGFTLEFERPSGLKLYDVYAEEDCLFFSTSSGIYKLSYDLCDQEGFSYFEKAEADVASRYLELLKEDLKAVDDTTKDRHGLTDEMIDGMTLSEVLRYYDLLTGKDRSERESQAVSEFIDANDWCLDYDPDLARIKVRKSAFDSSRYSLVRYSLINPGAVIYSPVSESFYVASYYDNLLHSVDSSRVRSIAFGDTTTLDDILSETTLSFGKKKEFNTSGCLKINRHANTLYAYFSNSNNVKIVDLSDGSMEVSCSFSSQYRIQQFLGNADNTSFHCLSQVKKTDIHNVTTNPNYVYSSNPQRAAQKSVYRLAFTLSLIVALICLVALIVSSACLVSDRAFRKTVTIGQDVKKNKWIYLALIPFVALLVLFCYYEAVGSISLSFYDYTKAEPSRIWNSFANYIEVFHADFWLQTGNMLFFLVFDIILSIIPPLIFAFCLSIMRNKKFSKFMRSLMFIPGIIPGVATMLIWKVGIFGDNGVLNYIFSNGSEPIQFLHNSDISRWSLLLMNFPYIGSYLIFYGGLMNIPKDYYEAGELAGMSVTRRFFQIDVPLIRPQIKYVFIVTIINSVQNFARTYMLDSTGTKTPAESMYRSILSGDYGLSSAYAVLIFVFLLGAVIVNFRSQKKDYMGDSL